MATDSERKHAAKLLAIHRSNLEILEEKKAQLGIDAPVSLTNQILEEQANIAALEPLAKPPPSQQVQEFIARTGGGEIDLAMLFMQGTQINARMTQAEQQNKQIIEEQSRAALWRMQTKETIDSLLVWASASEKARKSGAKWYRICLLGLFVLIVLHYFGAW